MLQMMQKKVTAEGASEEKLFDRYMCYCKDSEASLRASIESAESHLPDVESAIKESTAETSRLEAEEKQANIDRDEAQKGLDAATQLRDQESKANDMSATDLRTNIAALGNAVKLLSGGGSATFLQSSTAGALRQLSISVDMSARDRDTISAFLSTEHREGYEPRTTEIRGILQQMKEDMERSLDTLENDEANEKKRAKTMVQAKSEQITALGSQIDQKQTRLGELAVDKVNQQADLDDTTTGLDQDRKFLADLQQGCKAKQEEWGVRSKTRGQELQAIQDAIKILNDGEARELFKKSLPVPSFLQMGSIRKNNVREQALRALEKARRAVGPKQSRLAVLSMALRTKKVSFTKVIKMIDEMMSLLDKEQDDDDKKKAFCRTEIDKTDDAIRDVKLEIGDLDKGSEDERSKIASVTEEVSLLSDGVHKLDAQVKESTEQRKEEHADYVEKLSTNSATKELLETARKTLMRFYNAPDAPAKGASQVFVEVSSDTTQSSDAGPAPPPETWSGDYEKQHDDHTGVMGMIQEILDDVDKDNEQLKANEREAQFKYEEAMSDASKKRAGDARAIAEKEAVKAELEGRLHKMKQERKSKEKEQKSLLEYSKDMHNECDWLLANFDTRKDARAAEVESLRQAKGVLSGAGSSSGAE